MSLPLIAAAWRWPVSVLGLFFTALAFSGFALAAPAEAMDLTNHPVGYIAVLLFVIAYIFVMLEEKLHLRKSKPVLLAAMTYINAMEERQFAGPNVILRGRHRRRDSTQKAVAARLALGSVKMMQNHRLSRLRGWNRRWILLPLRLGDCADYSKTTLTVSAA